MSLNDKFNLKEELKKNTSDKLSNNIKIIETESKSKHKNSHNNVLKL